jgi:hypothetical protein
MKAVKSAQKGPKSGAPAPQIARIPKPDGRVQASRHDPSTVSKDRLRGRRAEGGRRVEREHRHD